MSESHPDPAVSQADNRDGSESLYAGAILRLLDRPVTAPDLAAGTDFAARPAESRIARTVGLLMFRLGDETLAVSARLLRRVTPLARACPIPHRSSGILRGLCNIRGELVLCADLRHLLGLPRQRGGDAEMGGSSDTSRMVVIGPADNSWAFEVDGLIGFERVDPSRFRPPPVTVEYAIGAFTTGVTEIGDQRVTILDGERILAGFKAALS